MLSKIGGWLLGAIAVIVGWVSIRRRIEQSGVKKQRKAQERAAAAVEKHLSDADKIIDEKAEAKIETIQKETQKALAKPAKTGGDANALLERIRRKK